MSVISQIYLAMVKKNEKELLMRFDRGESSGKRKIDSREKRVYFLIICEGEKTEPSYFSSFEKELPPYTLDIETLGKGYDPIGVVDAAIQRKLTSNKNFDSIWAVFDKDDFPASRFHAAIQKAEVNNIKCAWSNEAFELWYMLHFQYIDSALSRVNYQKYIEVQVNSRLPVQSKRSFSYKKNDPNMFVVLKKYGNQDQAIAWAKKLESSYQSKLYAKHNPCTLVFKLVEELNNPKKIVEAI